MLYLLYNGTKMALQLQPKTKHLHLSPTLLSVCGLVIGLISALLGIGGGTLTVPLLVSGNMAMRNAVGTASACGLPIAVAATLSYALLGMQATHTPAGSFGYIYLPAFISIVVTSVLMAPVGAKLAAHLPAKTLQRYFALMLFLAAVKLMF